MRFKYHDKDGKNEMGAECSIWANKEEGIVFVGVYQGDGNGDSYTIYVPNHREKILNLIADLQDVLDATMTWEQGYDGFSYNQASATSTGSMNKYPEEHVLRDEHGVIHWYG